MVWVVATVALAVALIGWILLVRRRDRALLQEACDVLDGLGHEGVAPSNLQAALDRIASETADLPADEPSVHALAALDRLSTGVVVADASGRVVTRNQAAMPYADGRHGDALVEVEVQNAMAAALQGEATDEQVDLHGPPDRVLVVVGDPLVVDGELIGAAVLIDDVSESVRLDAVRRDFVANVSHELRTPVGALSLLVDTLEGEDDPAVATRLRNRMQDEALRLTSLIDDLLDLSRIERGVDADRQVEIELGALVTEAADAIRPAANAAGVEVQVEIEEVPNLLGDRVQLISAVTNLFENAVKYTAEGGSVTGRLVTHGNEVAIAVVDTGIGIPQKDLPRIFERFYRVDRGRAVTSGGTGLGLSIVRHVAANHGGRVDVVSHEGTGSTFTLIFPVDVTDEPARESV